MKNSNWRLSRFSSWLFGFGIILAINACEHNALGVAPQPVIGLIPLNTGNRWEFRRTFFDPQGAVVTTRLDSIVIAGDTVVAGERWFYRSRFEPRPAYRNGEGGLLVRAISENSLDKFFVQYKYPAQIGELHPFPVAYYAGYDMWLSDTTYSATIISTDTIIAVPAGVYQCYQYRIFRKNGEGTYTDEFISPQHGWIKSDAYSKIGLQGSLFKANSLELLNSVIRR